MRRDINQAFIERYRCPENFVNFSLHGELSGEPGYFRFGQDAICYGQCSSIPPVQLISDDLRDVFADVPTEGSNRLPFDPTQVIENLRCERYVRNGYRERMETALRTVYHLARPVMPFSLRKFIKRAYFKNPGKLRFPSWPVDLTVERILERLLFLALKGQSVGAIPFIWFWPKGALSCAMVTHDVEALPGRDFCDRVMDWDDSVGIKSAFEIVPERRYPVQASFLASIRDRGFEVNVHDCNHDGYLFHDRQEFLRRAERINRYRRDFGAAGFRSGMLYRNVDWYQALDFSYDMSVPNVAHLDPQPGGCCTIMPFFVGEILELPTTTIQDYSLFHILGDYSIDLWSRQIAMITGAHGLASFIIHPDYVIDTRAQDTYKALLDHLARLRSDGNIWIALPQEVNDWWRQRSQMSLVRNGDSWQIEGPGKQQARLAYARLKGDCVTYELLSARE